MSEEKIEPTESSLLTTKETDLLSRCKILEVTPQVLFLMVSPSELGKTFELISTSIPEGATLMTARYNYQRKRFQLLIHHPSFPITEEGKEYDYLDAPTFMKG